MISLTKLLNDGLLAIPERDDVHDKKIHVSDVSVGCNKFTWHRIHEGATRTFDAKTRMKFERGYLWEALFDRIVEPQLIKAGWGRIEIPHLESADSVVGHEDRLYELTGVLPSRVAPSNSRLLVELKSSSSKFKDEQSKLEEHQTQYFIQAAGYARMPAIQADFAKVFVYFAPIDEVGEYDVDIPRFYKMYQERLKVMQTALGENPPEPVLPAWTMRKGKSYLCSSSCPVHTCKLNPAYRQETLV